MNRTTRLKLILVVFCACFIKQVAFGDVVIQVCPGSPEACKGTATVNGKPVEVNSEKNKGSGSVVMTIK